MTYRRFTHGPAAAYGWAVSPWDHLLHAYRAFGEVTSVAICGHAARTAALDADDGTAPECLGCIVAFAKDMIGPATDRFGWRAPQ